MANPPVWAPNAVATEKGWADPDSGELLIAVEGLLEEAPKKRTRKTTTEETTVAPIEEAPTEAPAAE